MAETNPPIPEGGAATIMSPLNLALLSLLGLIIYLRLFKPRVIPTLPDANSRMPPPLVFRTFTPPELIAYNGTTDPSKPILFAVKGKVFDVTPGKNFYGPGGPYQNFAGRDASRGLACGSFSEDKLTQDLDGPLDTLDNLTGDQKEALENWYGKFEEKYTIVGELVSVKEKQKMDAAKE